MGIERISICGVPVKLQGTEENIEAAFQSLEAGDTFWEAIEKAEECGVEVTRYT